MPLYMLGAPMIVGYPVVPLFENQGMGVAVFSYTGKVCWGINADWDMVPNVHEFVDDIRESFAELYTAALEPSRRRAAGRTARRKKAARLRTVKPRQRAAARPAVESAQSTPARISSENGGQPVAASAASEPLLARVRR